MKVVVTGSLAFDFIMNFPGKFSDYILPEKIHKINLSFLIDEMRQGRGGCAGNIAYNLALLGEKPMIVGVLGKDGGEYSRWLKRKGVDVSEIYFSRRLTASAFIMTDQVDNQIASFFPGASGCQRLTLRRIKERPDLIVIAPNPTILMNKFVLESQALGFDYLYDPGMQLPRLTKAELMRGIKGAKMVIGNDYEMEMINLKLNPPAGGQNSKLRRGKIWITTLGEKGSVIEHQGKKIKIPAAKPRNTSDPTGAGDAYRAGFIWAYLRGLPLKKAGRVGGLTAAYTVEKYGTTTHQFTMKEFRGRYKENFGEVL